MKQGFFILLCSLGLWSSHAQAQNRLDTVYAETYTGFDNGELGDCLQRNSPCAAFFTQIFPFQLPRTLGELKYKRIFADSSRTKIAREYVRNDDSSFFFAEYAPDKRLVRYGQLYLDYQPAVLDTVFEFDSIFNEIPKQILQVQPIRIFKTGLWQEALNVGVKAGFYSNDLPVGIWKCFSLPILAEFDMPTQLWHYQSGQIAKRDTLNLLEKKMSDIELKKALSGKWLNHFENNGQLLLSKKTRPIPCEVWDFGSNGELTVQAIFSYTEQKTFTGTWAIGQDLEVSLNVPEFNNAKVKLRFLDGNKLLFLKQ